MKLSTLTIILQLFALILLLSMILLVIISQAHMYHDTNYLYTPTPNITTH